MVFGTKDCRFESCQGHIRERMLSKSCERKGTEKESVEHAVSTSKRLFFESAAASA